MQSFRNLQVWQRSHKLTLELHDVTSRYPKSQIYGLTTQTTRAAGSIGANLAEGCGRGTDADFRRFVQIAMGSASELENHLQLAFDLKFLDEPKYQHLNNEIVGVKRMLSSLLKRLNEKPRADS
jgi:four helix bundle protein